MKFIFKIKNGRNINVRIKDYLNLTLCNRKYLTLAPPP